MSDEKTRQQQPSATGRSIVGRSSGMTENAIVPYDTHLLERARTQWQFGDWISLAAIDADSMQHHPDRARLAVYAACGHLQTNNRDAAKELVRLAQDWGVSKDQLVRALVAGVHNSIARAAAISGQESRSIKHFEAAVVTGMPGNDARLLTCARVNEQLRQIGLRPDPGKGDLGGPASTQKIADNFAKKLKDEIKAEVHTEFKANNPNPYAHNRILTPALNKSLRDFAANNLGRDGLKPAYIDYLGTKAIQIERSCVGRLATTVQDAIARQLVAECVTDDSICILEIGALYGISLAILYNHAITRFSAAKVVCLDPFDGYYGKALDAVLNQPVNSMTFVRNMHLADVPESDCQLITHYSTAPEAVEAASKLPVNLLIIDGDHSYEGVKYDFDTYFPMLKPGGYVILDDYNAKEWPGVQQFVDQDLQKHPDFEYLGAISRTAVGRKRG